MNIYSSLLRLRLILIYRVIIKELQDLLAQDMSPIMSSAPTPILEDRIQRPLTNFSSVTHGLGIPAFCAVLTAVQVCFSTFS